MYSQRFQCTTQEPIVLFKKAKTEQSTETLEYLPGSLFRGFVANKLFKQSPLNVTQIDEIIFNGKVRFGDAHLVINDQRSLPFPLAIHKYQNTEKHKLECVNLTKIKAPVDKHKQVREGYFVFEDGKYHYRKPNLSERMKASRSLEHRASEEGGMYLYRFIEPQQEFEFYIHSEEKKDLEVIGELLKETVYLGKSKSAEFGGKLSIRAIGEPQEEPLYAEEEVEIKHLMAASNWCFLNEFGSFTAHITPQMLCGHDKAEIDWGKTFLRFRTYSPYNFHRNAFDAPRLLIEKGSVVTFKDTVKVARSHFENRIGVHKTEGFGEVSYQCDFLEQEEFSLTKATSSSVEGQTHSQDPIYDILRGRRESKDQLIEDFNKVDKLLPEFQFSSSIGHAQWGNILRKTKNVSDTEELRKKLFENPDTKIDKNKTTKWDSKNTKQLKRAIDSCQNVQAFKIFLKEKINEKKDV